MRIFTLVRQISQQGGALKKQAMLDYHPGNLGCSNIAELNDSIVGGFGNPPMVSTISAIIRIGQKSARWDFWCAVLPYHHPDFQSSARELSRQNFLKKNGGSSWGGAPIFRVHKVALFLWLSNLRRSVSWTSTIIFRINWTSPSQVWTKLTEQTTMLVNMHAWLTLIG